MSGKDLVRSVRGGPPERFGIIAGVQHTTGKRWAVLDRLSGHAAPTLPPRFVAEESARVFRLFRLHARALAATLVALCWSHPERR